MVCALRRVQRPDYVHFDLDPTDGESWPQVCETALVVHDALEALKMPNFAKTTGSRGIHIYVPITYGPVQKTVWAFAKQFAQSMESLHPKLITSEYRIAKRPKNHVLVDYNQNAWGGLWLPFIPCGPSRKHLSPRQSPGRKWRKA